MTEAKSNHGPDGKFIPGNNANPEGENGLRRTGQPWKIRMSYLEEEFDTGEKLLALFVKDPQTKELSEGPELLKRNPLDIGLLWQLVRQRTNHTEREAYWDRHDGKAIQQTEHTGKGGKDLAFAATTIIVQGVEPKHADPDTE